MATATDWATDAQVAICTLPAPARRAAVPARMTVPGMVGAPPTISTRPRAFLSPLSSGSGSGQPRSNSGVTVIVPSVASLACVAPELSFAMCVDRLSCVMLVRHRSVVVVERG